VDSEPPQSAAHCFGMRTPRTIRYAARDAVAVAASPSAMGDIVAPLQKYLLLSANLLRFDAKGFQSALNHAITKV
jgi:hypothetical protein